MKKRMLSWLLAMTMALSLTPAALADEALYEKAPGQVLGDVVTFRPAEEATEVTLPGQETHQVSYWLNEPTEEDDLQEHWGRSGGSGITVRPVPDPEPCPAGKPLELPEPPVKETWAFRGWYDRLSGSMWDPAAPLDRDLELEGRWTSTVERCSVSFDRTSYSSGNSLLWDTSGRCSVSVLRGQRVSHLPGVAEFGENSLFARYPVSRWMTEDGTPWSIDQPVTEDLELVPLEEKAETHQVVFHLNTPQEDNGQELWWTYQPSGGVTLTPLDHDGKPLPPAGAIAVEDGKTVQAPDVPALNTWTFDGWFIQGSGEQWTPDMPVTGDWTIDGRWTPKTPRATVTFDYSSSRSTQNADGSWSSSAYTGKGMECYASVPVGTKLSRLPGKADFQGNQFFEQDPVSRWELPDGTEWKPDTPVTGDITLTPLFEAAKTVKITFDWNGQHVEEYPAEEIPAGSKYSAPKLGVIIPGISFQGWGDKAGNPWKDGTVVSQDMTLYAIWKLETEDTFRFSNSRRSFRSNYQISQQAMAQLVGDDAAWGAAAWERAQKPWKGSCYGMSAVYTLARRGSLEVGRYQSGAKQLFDLEEPVRSDSVNDLINFYHLMQSSPEVGRLRGLAQRGPETENLRNLLQKLDQGDFVLVGLNLLDDGGERVSGHTVVAVDYEKDSAGSCVVRLWDPNQATGFNHMTVSADCSRKTLENPIGERDGSHIKVTYGLTPDQFDRYTLEGNGGTAMELGQLMLDAASFRLEASDGSFAVVKNGVQTEGKLQLLPADLDSGEDGDRMYYFDNGNRLTVTVKPEAAVSSVSLVCGDTYAKVDAKALTSVTVGKDAVSTATAQATQQTVTIASDTLGKDWNQVQVSGQDKGFTLEAKDRAVTVTSQNQVAVTTQAQNVQSGKTSGKVQAQATPSGVVLSTKKEGFRQAKPVAPQSKNPFTDVAPGAYYYDAVQWAVKAGVTAGKTATTFAPAAPCTRGQVVTFLWRAMGKPAPKTTVNPFTDVPASAYYSQAVLWAYETGITGGTTATTFSPDKPCTRGQVVTFLWRAEGKPAAAAKAAFGDVPAGAYYTNAVNWAVENKVTSGVTADSFAPNKPCNRGQIVTFLYRDLQK